MQRDSVSNTLRVAALLCIVCSVVVSAAAVGLRGRQEANKLLDKRKNVLLAAHLVSEEEATAQKIQEIFDQRIETELVDLETGRIVDEADVDFDVAAFDAKEAARSQQLGIVIASEDDLGGIKRRAKYAQIYRINGDDGRLESIVLPIHGKGLWSTLYGFIALESDYNTVAGITFYEHAETPGLGGEIENKNWQALWQGKQVYNAESDVALEVVKGTAATTGEAAEHEIDGLSGATITSRGVSNLIAYWLGPNGFGPYIENQQ